jgi:hypothetical protein
MKQEKNIELANRVAPGNRWDVNGIIYFTVNPEVLSLFTTAQLDTCVPYDEIVLPPNPPMK